MFNILVFVRNVPDMGASIAEQCVGREAEEIERTGQYGPFASEDEAFCHLEKNGWKRPPNKDEYTLHLNLGPLSRHFVFRAKVIPSEVRNPSSLPRL